MKYEKYKLNELAKIEKVKGKPLRKARLRMLRGLSQITVLLDI